MATNFYFQSGNTSGTTSEQRLIEDLIIESLKIYGHDVYYMPRTSVKLDKLFGEDILSQFTQAYPIEMYFSNVDGWDGEREIFTKFGIEIRDRATFVVSKRRWEESVSNQSPSIELPLRPAEGDLIYFPKTDAMFEIKYVEHMNPFYQLGKFYIFSLQCELYQYSSENIETGIPEIDADFARISSDIFDYNVTSQTGDIILTQTGGSLVQEVFDTILNNPLSNNTLIEQEASDIVDFTSINPFGEV